ncbi:hypothetical protein [Aliivibrio salmonicida]|uniref:hypothetical protein n=1 Tax=Aliivibrio salmonicida TaxID=40269 RepID=UPI003D1270CA
MSRLSLAGRHRRPSHSHTMNDSPVAQDKPTNDAVYSSSPERIRHSKAMASGHGSDGCALGL